MLLNGDPELGGIQLRIVEIGPGARDVGRLGGDAHAQAAVHVGADLEPRGFAAGGAAAAAARGEGKLGEAVRDGFQLQEGRELDVDVWFLQRGLDGGGDGVGMQHADGDVLGDDLFVLSAQGSLEMSLISTTGGLQVLVDVAKGVVEGRRGL